MKPHHDIHAVTRHRWQSILPYLGIDAGCLKNKHQPCPLCGGKDRFRFDDKDGNGTYYCNQCGAGNGFTLVMKLLQTDFKGAVKAVESVLGIGQGDMPMRAVQPPKNAPKCETDRISRLMNIWHGTQPIGETAKAYFSGRGIEAGRLPETLSESVRFHPRLDYWTSDTHGNALHIGAFPCIVAAITDTSGQIQGLHLTYLQTDGSGKLAQNHPQTGELLPAKKMQSRFSGSISGHAVQLTPPHTGSLIVAEGIETALAAKQLFSDSDRYGLYAALSANGMAALVLPPDLRELLIIADHDTPRPVGFQAAHTLAMRAIKSGIKTRIWQPETAGYDALDELNHLNSQTAVQEGKP